MTALGKWALSGGVTTAMTNGDMTPATDGGMNVGSTVISNDSNLDVYVDIEVVLGALSPSGSRPFVQLYLLEAVDGTNYPAQSISGTTSDQMLAASQFLATIPIGNTAATAQRVVFRKAVMPPGKFKLAIRNKTGANFAGSGNSVNFLPYNLNLNA